MLEAGAADSRSRVWASPVSNSSRDQITAVSQRDGAQFNLRSATLLKGYCALEWPHTSLSCGSIQLPMHHTPNAAPKVP